MYIVVKYKMNLHSQRNRLVNLAKKIAFLSVSKACRNKFYVFRLYARMSVQPNIIQVNLYHILWSNRMEDFTFCYPLIPPSVVR